MLKSSWCRIWQIFYFQNTHWVVWTNYISFLNSTSELEGTLEVIASHRYGNWGPETRDLFKVTVLWVLTYVCIYEAMVCQYFCMIKKKHKVFFHRWNRRLWIHSDVLWFHLQSKSNPFLLGRPQRHEMKTKTHIALLCELNKINKEKKAWQVWFLSLKNS